MEFGIELKNDIINVQLNSDFRNLVLDKFNNEAELWVKSGYIMYESSFDYYMSEILDNHDDLQHP